MAKRGNGTLYRRGNLWWIQYYIRGRLMQQPTGFAHKADAENLLKQRIGEVAAGRCVGPERATIADLCRLVMEDHGVRHLRDARHVEWRYQSHIAPLLGRLLASRFGPAQVRQISPVAEPTAPPTPPSIGNLPSYAVGLNWGPGKTPAGPAATGDSRARRDQRAPGILGAGPI
jgi:hypothetical protein